MKNDVIYCQNIFIGVNVMTEGPLIWLIASPLVYWGMYMNAVEFSFMMDDSKIDSSNIWRFFITSSRETWRLWSWEFLKVHCPWSKKTSIKYRIEEAHRLLSKGGMKHEKGWTAEDCHDPQNYEQIAHDCFCYRSTFWAKGLLEVFVITPIRTVVLMIVGLIMVATLPFMAFRQLVFRR